MFSAPRQQPLRITSRQKGVRSEELSTVCADGKGTAHRIMRGGNTLEYLETAKSEENIYCWSSSRLLWFFKETCGSSFSNTNIFTAGFLSPSSFPPKEQESCGGWRCCGTCGLTVSLLQQILQSFPTEAKEVTCCQWYCRSSMKFCQLPQPEQEQESKQ